MRVIAAEIDVEDIFNDSLEFLGEQALQEDGQVRYGELVLSVAPKEGKAVTLLADHLFSPALFLAERIERGLVSLGGRTAIELGAGCALPSLLASTLPPAPSLVVVTDYPDAVILDNLRANVQANEALVSSGCSVLCRGYEWGTESLPLLHLLQQSSPDAGYDVVILSDLLHFDASHTAIMSSVTSLLARTSSARVLAAAGTYTAPHICEDFLRKAEGAGLVFEEGEKDDVWRGEMPVSGVTIEQLGVRKGMCRWWTGRWRDGSEASRRPD